MSNLATSIVSAIGAVVGPPPVALHEPSISEREHRLVSDCLESTYVSTVGPYVAEFERRIQEFTGSPHAVATVNGTSALHVALLLAGVSPGDEVLVPALSFVATANAVTYCGAVPHFVDIEPEHLGMDPLALRDWLADSTHEFNGLRVNTSTGRTIRCVVPMHTFGHPCKIAELSAVADDFELTLVEDAAESLGSWSRDRHTGTFGLLGVLSFNGNKIVSTGGGGAILTANRELANRARHLTTTAKLPHRWQFIHDEVGYNYRLPNLNAALGCAQMERLPHFLISKRALYERYRNEFRGIVETAVFAEPDGCVSNYWLQTLVLGREVASERDQVLLAATEAGYMVRPAWTPLPDLPPFKSCPHAPIPVARDLSSRLVNLPSSAGLA